MLMAHILIVEDDAMIARILTIGLQRADHTVFLIKDGTEAFAYARDHMPALILLDVLLPGMDGFQILSQLKHHPTTRAIPVFMLTAQSDGASIIAGIDGGAEAYLSKPVDIPDVVRRIGIVLQRPNVGNKNAGNI
jgi:DNA-binding response OmpR family regulator